MLDWLVPYVDYLFLGSLVVQNLAFLPTVIRPNNKPDRLTSVITTGVLATVMVGFLALNLILSAGAIGVLVLEWGITIFQRRT